MTVSPALPSGLFPSWKTSKDGLERVLLGGGAFEAVYLLLLFWLIFHPALSEPRSLATALGGGLLLVFLKPPDPSHCKRLGRIPLTFLLFAPLSALWAASAGVALQSAGFLFLGVTLTLLLTDLDASVRERMRTIALIAVLAACAMAFVQRFAMFGAMEKTLPAFSGEERGVVASAVFHKRVFGPLATPGSLAALLLLFIPAAVLRAFRDPAARRGVRPGRAVWAAISVILLTTLFMTGSVGAGLCLTAAGAAVLAARGRRRLSAGLFVLGVAALAGWILSRGSVHWSLSSLGARVTLWGSAVRMWLDLPVLGWGWGHFEEAYRSLGQPLSEGSKYAHNVLLQVLVEGGVVGLLLLLSALSQLVRRARFPTKGMPLAAFTGALAFALFSLLDLPLTMPELVFLFPLFLAEVQFRPEPGRIGEPAFPFESTFLPVMGVLLVTGFWPPFRPWSLALASCVLFAAAATGERPAGKTSWVAAAGAAYFVLRAFLSPSSLGAVRFLETAALAGAFILWMRSLPDPARAARWTIALPLLWAARAWWDTVRLIPDHGWKALTVPISWVDYSNPRTMAVLLVPFLVLILSGTLVRRGRTWLFLAGLASLLRLWSVAALAGSAAGWTAASKKHRAGSKMAIIVGLVLVSVITLRFLNPSPTRWSRLSIWKSSASVFLENPLFGPGPGVFPFAYERVKEPRENWAARHLMGTPAAHSDPLDLCLAFGLIGVFFAGWGAVRWWRGERDPLKRAAALGLGVPACVQIVFHSPPAVLTGAALLAPWKKDRAARSHPLAGALSLMLALALFGPAAFAPLEVRRAEILQSQGRLPAAYQALKRTARLNAWDARYPAAIASFEEEMFLRTGDGTWRSLSDDSFARTRILESRDGHWALEKARRDTQRARKDPSDTNREEALRSWQEACRALPFSAFARLERGLFEVRTGLKDPAFASFSRAVELEPFFARAWVNRGNLLKERRDPWGALACYRTALEADVLWKDAPLAALERELTSLPDGVREILRRELAQGGGR